MLFEATFINKSGKWTDMNEIKFSLLEPKEDIFYSSFVNEKQFIGIKKSYKTTKKV